MAKKKQISEISFEESLQRLEEIVNEIESHTSLENSVKLYKEGVGLSVLLNEALNKYEAEIIELSKTKDGQFEEKPFTVGQGPPALNKESAE